MVFAAVYNINGDITVKQNSVQKGQEGPARQSLQSKCKCDS